MTDIISNEELEKKLEACPAPRVTKDYIESRITGTTFTRITETLTHCVIQLDNGFTATGEAACVNVANYNKEIGEKIAHDNAFSKLWALYGFLLAENKELPALKEAEGGIVESYGTRLEKLEEITRIQCSEGNYTVNEYMRGMANGMILAVATLNDTDPVYFDAPDAPTDEAV
jgi:hypothetical protein